MGGAGDVTIKTARVHEVAAVLALWRAAEAEPSATDDAESIELLLRRDPDAVLVATDGEQIIGTVIAGWDGWRVRINAIVMSEHEHAVAFWLALGFQLDKRVGRFVKNTARVSA